MLLAHSGTPVGEMDVDMVPKDCVGGQVRFSCVALLLFNLFT